MFGLYRLLFWLIIPVLIKLNLSKPISQNAEISDLIMDFVTSNFTDPNLPNVVLENMCWDQDSKFQLYNKLVKNQVFFSGYHVENSSELLQKLTLNRFFHFIIVIDLDCAFDEFYQQALANNVLLFPTSWLIFGNVSQLYVKNLYIPVNRVFVISQYNSTANIWSLTSVYKTNKYFKGYLKNSIGSWTSQGGLHLNGPFILSKNRSNFGKMPFRVSYVFSKPHFDDMYTYRNKEKDSWSKMNLFIMQEICDYWNMTHIMIFRNDWGFKYRHPTKHFLRGAFADILQERADSMGTMAYMRVNIFKFLYTEDPYFQFAIFYIAPPLPYYSNLFALPFDTTCWILIGTMIVLLGIIIRIIFLWEQKVIYFAKVAQENEENYPNSSDVFVMQLAIVCQMGISYEPKSASGKLVTFVGLLTITFLYTAFSANIVLFLQAKTTNIKDIGDLHNVGYEFGVQDTIYNRYYFTKSDVRTNEYYRKLIYKNNLVNSNGTLKNFMTAEEGVRQMAQNYFAFHADPQAAYYAIQKRYTNAQKCGLRKVDTIFKAEPMYVPLPKNSTYYEFLLISIRKIQEAGLLAKEQKIFYSKMPKCIGHGNMFFSVGIIESYFAFYIFGIGFAISVMLFFLEVLVCLYVGPRDQNIVKVLVKTKIHSEKC